MWKSTAERRDSHIRCSVSCEETYEKARPRKKGAICIRLTNEFREGPSCSRAELEAAKYQLRQIISDETRGYLLRARVAFLDAGETSRQFASAIETSRGKASSLVAVKCQDDDSIAHTTSCILHQVSSFYESLLMEEATNPDEVSVFLSSVTTKLASPVVEYLYSFVTLDEYSEALRSLQPGKSPGSNGLPAEFYKRFWDVLGSESWRSVSALLYSLSPCVLGISGCCINRVTERICATGGLSHCLTRIIKF